MKKACLSLMYVSIFALMVGCKGNANLYSGAASTSQAAASPQVPEQCEKDCEKGCMLPAVKDHILGGFSGTATKPGSCNLCVSEDDWNNLPSDTKDSVQAYISAYGGDLNIAEGNEIDGLKCVTPIDPDPSDKVCNIEFAKNYNEESYCCVVEFCPLEGYEESSTLDDEISKVMDYIMANNLPSQQVKYGPNEALCKTVIDNSAPKLCAVEDEICLGYTGNNTGDNCDPNASSAVFLDIKANDIDKDDEEFSITSIYHVDENFNVIDLNGSSFIEIKSDMVLVKECFPHKKFSYRVCRDNDPTICDDTHVVINRDASCVCQLCSK